jgi:hypothetical protein
MAPEQSLWLRDWMNNTSVYSLTAIIIICPQHWNSSFYIMVLHHLLFILTSNTTRREKGWGVPFTLPKHKKPTGTWSSRTVLFLLFPREKLQQQIFKYWRRASPRNLGSQPPCCTSLHWSVHVPGPTGSLSHQALQTGRAPVWNQHQSCSLSESQPSSLLTWNKNMLTFLPPLIIPPCFSHYFT